MELNRAEAKVRIAELLDAENRYCERIEELERHLARAIERRSYRHWRGGYADGYRGRQTRYADTEYLDGYITGLSEQQAPWEVTDPCLYMQRRIEIAFRKLRSFMHTIIGRPPR